MEKKADIIPFLEGIVEENTRSYQSDLKLDERILQAAMLEVRQENRTFLWMSRPCGTRCLLEREVFLRETSAHITWTHYDYDAEYIKIYQGTDSATLKKGAGHFTNTSIWNGNVSLAAHNRGANSYFGEIHTLENGDRITLTTKEGTRTYSVTSVSKISETDNSMLESTSENCITLFTCVRDQREYRWCVRAVET